MEHKGIIGALLRESRLRHNLRVQAGELSISFFHWYLTDAGATINTRCMPRLRRRSSVAASACTILPNPISLARITRPRQAAKMALAPDN